MLLSKKDQNEKSLVMFKMLDKEMPLYWREKKKHRKIKAMAKTSSKYVVTNFCRVCFTFDSFG